MSDVGYEPRRGLIRCQLFQNTKDTQSVANRPAKGSYGPRQTGAPICLWKLKSPKSPKPLVHNHQIRSIAIQFDTVKGNRSLRRARRGMTRTVSINALSASSAASAPEGRALLVLWKKASVFTESLSKRESFGHPYSRQCPNQSFFGKPQD